MNYKTVINCKTVNWYKIAQQHLLFNPWYYRHRLSDNFNENISPSSYDKQDKPIYKCHLCNRQINESDIATWTVVPNKMVSYFLPLNNFNLEEFNSDLYKISNFLKNIFPLSTILPNTDEKIIEETCQKIIDSGFINFLMNLNSIKILEKEEHSQLPQYTKLLLYIINTGTISKNELIDLSNFITNLGYIYGEMEEYIRWNQIIEKNLQAPICNECIENYPKCEACNKFITDTSTMITLANGDKICRKCWENGEYDCCSQCGVCDYSNEMLFIQEEMYCKDCAKKLSINYEDYTDEIDAAAEKNPYPFKHWFPKEQNRVYIPFYPNMNLNDLDISIVNELNNHGCNSNVENYMLGYCFEGKRKVRIGKFIEKIKFKAIQNAKRLLKDPEELKTVINGLSQRYDKALKQFNESDFRKVKQSSQYLVAISQEPYDIARMSTGRDWKSCMQLGIGSKYEDVFCEIEAGTLIAYLIRKDDKEIENPVARIAIKRFTNNEGQSFALPEDQIYGNAPQSFYEIVHQWIDSQQGKMPKGTYEREGGGYSDTFRSTMNVAKNIVRQIIKLAQIETRNWYKNIKLASPIMDTNEHNQIGYMNIGHGHNKLDPTKVQVFMWIWHNNRLEVYDIKKKPIMDLIKKRITDHEQFRRNLGIINEKNSFDPISYEGRAEIYEKQVNVSIAIPNKLKFRPIPEDLINALHNRFGYNTKIYTYL